jgi:hypothetical protein
VAPDEDRAMALLQPHRLHEPYRPHPHPVTQAPIRPYPRIPPGVPGARSGDKTLSRALTPTARAHPPPGKPATCRQAAAARRASSSNPVTPAGPIAPSSPAHRPHPAGTPATAALANTPGTRPSLGRSMAQPPPASPPGPERGGNTDRSAGRRSGCAPTKDLAHPLPLGAFGPWPTVAAIPRPTPPMGSKVQPIVAATSYGWPN